MIFVLNKNKQPLNPCHSAVARKLLKTGYFDIKNKEGVRIAQGINYKYCKVLSRADGYEYTLNGLEVDSFLPYGL
jgi:hypothetical protein